MPAATTANDDSDHAESDPQGTNLADDNAENVESNEAADAPEAEADPEAMRREDSTESSQP